MLSVHIVGYNNPAHTANAILSVLLYAPIPFEILILENGADDAAFAKLFQFIPSFQEVAAARNLDLSTISRLLRPQDASGKVQNLGFARGLNFLAGFASLEAKFFVQMNNDMFLTPEALPLLQTTLERNPSIGIACCKLTNGGLYSRTAPERKDVENFTELVKSEPGPEVSEAIVPGSNHPLMISRELWDTLRAVDVWSDRKPLFLNLYGGAYDESIDPSPVNGWYSDWDFYNRILSLKLATVIVSRARAYHYDHVSCEPLDASNPEWTQASRINYSMKYGVVEKDQPVTQRFCLDGYPARRWTR